MEYSNNSSGINYLVQGDGIPVLLIHGMAASLQDWASLSPSLALAGFRAYRLDLPGHGQSEKPDDPSQYHIEAFSSRLSGWIDSLQLPEPPLLVGHSLGSYLSLYYAMCHPENVRGMVLINPLYSPEQLAPILRVIRRRPALGVKAMRAVPEWLINLFLGWDPSSAANFSPEIRQQIANDYKRASPHFLYITRDFPDLSGSLGVINIPVLVIWGEHDLTLNPDSFQHLVQCLPNATGHAIPGSGHQPHIGNPNLVNRLTVEFARSVSTKPLLDNAQLPSP